MFDIGWSEIAVIAVVALIAIGPKELPGVLRMVGQWMGKARKMASEFQGQFNEAMREAEMADLKKSFDEVKEAATGFASGNIDELFEKVQSIRELAESFNKRSGAFMEEGRRSLLDISEAASRVTRKFDGPGPRR